MHNIIGAIRAPMRMFKVGCLILSATIVCSCAVAGAQEAYSVGTPTVDTRNATDEMSSGGVAPVWPFQGFFDPAAGRFWDTASGQFHDLGSDIGFGDCLEEYVIVSETAIWLGYRSYVDPIRAKHFVIPWNDIAYPVIGAGVALGGSSSPRPPESDTYHEIDMTAKTKIAISPVDVQWNAGEEEGGYVTYVVGFEATNSSESRWYRPVEPLRGIVEYMSDGSVVEELTAQFNEGGPRWYFEDVYIVGSDGRYYGLTLYDVGHPMCSDVARTFLIDGESGAIVGCHEVRMERVTPLVFVQPDGSGTLRKFELPDVPSPVGLGNCPARIDYEPLSFFDTNPVGSPSSSSGHTGNGSSRE